MIVVVIIGILAAIAIPIFANQQKAAILSGVKADVKNTNTNIATALVKAPTSSNVTTLLGASGFVKSDENTVLTVAGTWDNYYVYGSNSAVLSGGTGLFNAIDGTKAFAATNETTLKEALPSTNPWASVLYSSKLGKTITVGR